CDRAAVPASCGQWSSRDAGRRVVLARTASSRESLSVEHQLDRLEEMVRRLEAEELDLDEALKLFEEGIERLREARARLTAAEAQVKQVLSDQAGHLKVEDFDG